MDSPQVQPPWGSLPYERFVLSNWENAEGSTDAQKRASLATQWLRQGYEARQDYIRASFNKCDYTSYLPPSPVPSQQQIRQCLVPLRTVEQRTLVVKRSVVDAPFCIRICYEDRLEAGHMEVKDSLDPFEAFGAMENYLDDSTLYNFLRQEWPRILDVFPDLLLGPMESVPMDEAIPKLKEQFMQQNMTDLRANALEAYSAGRKQPIDEADFERYLVLRRYDELQRALAAGYLIVEDDVAQETGELLLVWYDQFGYVLRSARVDAGVVRDYHGEWMAATGFDTSEWEEKGTVGVEYLDGGSQGPPY